MSINIYTFYPEDKHSILIDNDSYFWQNISASMIDSIGKETMQQIDNAIILDIKSNAIKTPLGVTQIENLSTGCKTVLNYLYANPKYDFINVTQCGANALEVLFQTMEKVPHIQRKLILQHKDSLIKCKDREYIIHYEDNTTEKIKSLIDM